MGGDRERAGCCFVLSFYCPRVTRKENKEPVSKGCNTCGRRRYLCSLTSTGVSTMGVPCQLRYARRRDKPLDSGRRSGHRPRVAGAQRGPAGVSGRRARSGDLGSPLYPRGWFYFPRSPNFSLSDNLQLLLFFPSIVCSPSAS